MFYNAMLHTTCVATMLSGGHAENALPQRAGATIQCRMLPDDSQADVQARLTKALADPAIRISVTTPPFRDPIHRDAHAQAQVRSRRGIHVAGRTGGAGYGRRRQRQQIHARRRHSDFRHYRDFTDIDDNRAHGKDERIAVSGFYEDVEFTYRLMKAFSARISDAQSSRLRQNLVVARPFIKMTRNALRSACVSGEGPPPTIVLERMVSMKSRIIRTPRMVSGE